MSSLGNLHRGIEKLKKDLKAIKYPNSLDSSPLQTGNPVVILSLLHYILVDYSPLLNQSLLDQGYELYSRNDSRFLSTIYKLLASMFRYRPPLSQEQFFSLGFAEQKVLLCLDVLKLGVQKHSDLIKAKLAKAKNAVKQKLSLPEGESGGSISRSVQSAILEQEFIRPPSQSSMSELSFQTSTVENYNTSPILPSSSATPRDTSRKSSPSPRNIATEPTGYMTPINTEGPAAVKEDINSESLELIIQLLAESGDDALAELFTEYTRLMKRIEMLEEKLRRFMEKTDAMLNLLWNKVRLLEDSKQTKAVINPKPICL